MGLTTTTPGKTARTRTASVVRIVDNPLGARDARLARSVEASLRQLLAPEDLGTVEVRFRICDEGAAGLRFICKVENPPDASRTPWRWWSPLLESAADFHAAFEEALELRRQRLLPTPRTGRG